MFTWKALYNDGSFLSEIDEGIIHKYPEINREKLTKFMIIDEQNIPRVSLAILPGQKLIYRKRRQAHREGGVLVTHATIHVVGFHENRDGVNVQMLAFVFPDGRVELMDRFRSDNPDYIEIENLLDEEK